jgi:hypothetical protein
MAEFGGPGSSKFPFSRRSVTVSRSSGSERRCRRNRTNKLNVAIWNFGTVVPNMGCWCRAERVRNVDPVAQAPGIQRDSQQPSSSSLIGTNGQNSPVQVDLISARTEWTKCRPRHRVYRIQARNISTARRASGPDTTAPRTARWSSTRNPCRRIQSARTFWLHLHRSASFRMSVSRSTAYSSTRVRTCQGQGYPYSLATSARDLVR